jgi:hypothetical protein
VRLGDRDPAVRQFERDAVIVLAVMVVGALILRRGNPDGALGVLLGAALMVVSYWAIKGAVDLLLARRRPGGGEAPLRARTLIWQGAKFIGRYALLAVGAYVMLIGLRAHPVGVLCGVSVPVLAAVVQLPRLWRRGARPR